MLSFWKSKKLQATKEHECAYCTESIDVGEKCFEETGFYENDFNHFYLHDKCTYYESSQRVQHVDNFYEGKGYFGELMNNQMKACENCGVSEYNFQLNNKADNMSVICKECGLATNEKISMQEIMALADSKPDKKQTLRKMQQNNQAVSKQGFKN